MLLGPIRLPADPARRPPALMDAVLRSLGTSIQVTASPATPRLSERRSAAAARLTDLVAGDLVTLDERTTDLRILQGTSNVTSTVTHRLVYSLTGFETFLVYWGAPNGAPLDLEITVANATTPMVRDPLTGASQAPTRVQKGRAGQPAAAGASGRRPSADRRLQLRQQQQPRHERRRAEGSAAAGRGDHLSVISRRRPRRTPSCRTTSPTSASNSISIRRRPIRPTTS